MRWDLPLPLCSVALAALAPLALSLPGCSSDDCNAQYNSSCGVISPEVSITEPASSSPLSGQVTVRATISSQNPLVSVQGFVDDALLYDEASGNTVEFSFSTNVFTRTEHTIRVTAIDNQNLFGSARVTAFFSDGRPVPDSGIAPPPPPPPPRDAGFAPRVDTGVGGNNDAGTTPGADGGGGVPDSGVHNTGVAFSPNEVYYLGASGRVNPGIAPAYAEPRFICDMSGTNQFWGGLAWARNTRPRIRPTDGRIIYKQPDMMGLAAVITDNLQDHPIDGWHTPIGWQVNDTLIDTPDCTNQGRQVAEFRLHPRTGEIYYRCLGVGGAWYTTSAGAVNICNGRPDSIGVNGEVLCEDFRQVQDRTGTLHSIVFLDANGVIIEDKVFVDPGPVRARPGGGFWVAEEGFRYAVTSSGTATVDGSYGGAVPQNILDASSRSDSVMDINGNVFRSFDAGYIIRFDISNQTASVYFEPVNEPDCLTALLLLTGP